MSRFFSEKYSNLVPYTPGEQPKERKYIKLNTNESPFPPSEIALKMAAEASKRLMLYPDPDCKELTAALADLLDVSTDEIVWTNGSDDVLNFAFMAFCDDEHPAIFPDITYGFYSVFAEANRIPYRVIPLKEDFSISIEDFKRQKGTVFIANPNAPTGIALTLEQIEDLLLSDPNRVVVIDEAYVDFGGESCVPLIKKYDNLLVTQTFSKSRSMAGARLGFAVGSKDLISDIHTLRYATNPYNINTMTMAAGIGVLRDEDYTRTNCAKIIENRAYISSELKKLGFEMTDSKANFIFVRHPAIHGEKLYLFLKENGILVRHFSKARISEYCRITIGSREEMDELLKKIQIILEELV
ncbi:MAG: histidinol-phosphate transaminase [Ruminococcaceae bacterium]|nr:histidinol-phosphate transaminase [Oscillospiraceae bacterium]